MKQKYSSSGIRLPENWNKLSLSQRKKYLNAGKPSMGTIYYSIVFDDNKRKFSVTDGSSVYNLESFKNSILAAWPKAIDVIFYNSEIVFNNERKQYEYIKNKD